MSLDDDADVEMVDDADELDADYVFLREDSSRVGAWLCLIGGILAIGFSVLGLVVAIVACLGQLAMHGITTAPCLLGISLIGCAAAFWKTARQVTVGADGFLVDEGRTTRRIPWTDIGWATVQTGSMNAKKSLVLYGPDGRQKGMFGDAFSDFDHLVELTKSQVANRDEDGKADQTRRKVSRRASYVTAASGMFLLLIAVANVWMAREEQRTAKLLKTGTVEGTATVVRRFLAPNGTTRRLEYKVTDENGLADTRNAEVTPTYWESLEGVDTVPVRFVPGEPGISRLIEGEVSESDAPAPPEMMIGLSVIIALIAIGALTAAAFQWHGWDIGYDNKRRGFSMKPYGEG